MTPTNSIIICLCFFILGWLVAEFRQVIKAYNNKEKKTIKSMKDFEYATTNYQFLLRDILNIDDISDFHGCVGDLNNFLNRYKPVPEKWVYTLQASLDVRREDLRRRDIARFGHTIHGDGASFESDEIVFNLET